MNTKTFSPLVTLEQQRVELPLLLYRQGVRAKQLPSRPMTYGLIAAPEAQPESAMAMSPSRRDCAAPVFLRGVSIDGEYQGNAPRGPLGAAGSATTGQGKKISPVSGILRMLSLMSLFVLGGCAGFTQPMTDMELRAEADDCAKSSLCRVLIEDRPTVLTLAANDARLCETNARIAEGVLEREGVETRRFVVRLKAPRSNDFKTEAAQTQLLHTFVAANVNKRWYAVDNGSLPFCDRICKLSEALHGVELISGDIKPRVSVGAAVIAAR